MGVPAIPLRGSTWGMLALRRSWEENSAGTSDCPGGCTKGGCRSWVRVARPSTCTEQQLAKIQPECGERGAVNWCLKTPPRLLQ